MSLLLRDITLAIKVGTSLISSLIALPTFHLTKRFTKLWWAGEVSAFLVLFNPLHIQLLNNFLKNVAGILFLLCFLCFFLKTCENPKSLNYAASFIFLLLTFLTHIHPSGLGILFILGYIALLWILEREPPKREIRVSAILLASLMLGLVIVVVFVPGALTKFSKVLSFISSISSLKEETLRQLSIFGMKEIFYLFSIPIILGLTYLIHDVWKERSGWKKLLLASIHLTCLFLSLPFIPRAWR